MKRRNGSDIAHNDTELDLTFSDEHELIREGEALLERGRCLLRQAAVNTRVGCLPFCNDAEAYLQLTRNVATFRLEIAHRHALARGVATQDPDFASATTSGAAWPVDQEETGPEDDGFESATNMSQDELLQMSMALNARSEALLHTLLSAPERPPHEVQGNLEDLRRDTVHLLLLQQELVRRWLVERRQSAH